MINVLIHYEYTILTKLFVTIPDNYQWMLALTFPIIREVNVWVLLKLAYKAASANDTSVTISVSHNLNTRHCVFLSVTLGTEATDLTSWVILGTDFVYNTYLAAKIIWIKRRRCTNNENDEEMFHLMYSLTINELVEVVVPLTYMICFLFAFYGPNGEQIGGVRSNHFHYIPVSDINRFIANMTLLLMVDFMSVLLVACMLWIFCKINFARAYMLMQKEFWILATITTAHMIYVVGFYPSTDSYRSHI